MGSHKPVMFQSPPTRNSVFLSDWVTSIVLQFLLPGTLENTTRSPPSLPPSLRHCHIATKVSNPEISSLETLVKVMLCSCLWIVLVYGSILVGHLVWSLGVMCHPKDNGLFSISRQSWISARVCGFNPSG